LSAVRRLGSLKLNFYQAMHSKDMFCIIMPNFMEIGRTVAKT